MGCGCKSKNEQKGSEEKKSINFKGIITFIFVAILTVIALPLVWILLLVATYQGTVGDGFNVNSIINLFKKNKNKEVKQNLDFEGLEVVVNEKMK